MKLAKLLLAGVVVFSALKANADPITVQPKVIQTGVIPNRAENERAKLIREFNESARVQLTGYSAVEKTIHFNYEIANLTKKAIRIVQWQSTLKSGEKSLLVHDVPVVFSKPLKSKTTAQVEFEVPLPHLNEEVLKALAESTIVASYAPRQIIFADGSEITLIQ